MLFVRERKKHTHKHTETHNKAIVISMRKTRCFHFDKLFYGENNLNAIWTINLS